MKTLKPIDLLIYIIGALIAPVAVLAIIYVGAMQ